MTEQEFWNNIEVGTPTSCWNWKGTLSTHTQRVCVEQRSATTTRRAKELATGHYILPKQRVVHTCGNRRCHNPEHLQIVTSVEYTYKTRRLCGYNYPTKLQRETILQIYRAHKGGQTVTSLAQQFEVSIPCISSIVRGDSWKHLYHHYDEV